MVQKRGSLLQTGELNDHFFLCGKYAIKSLNHGRQYYGGHEPIIVACGHGSAERCPPGLCCDTLGQSGRIATLCVSTYLCASVACVLPCQSVWSCMRVCQCASAGRILLSKARVSSSYGQLYAVWLSRQQIARRRDAGSEERKRSIACEGEVSGRPQWSQDISVILSEVTAPLTYEWITRKVV